MKQIGHYTYDEINCLGQGAYGKVYEGLNTLNNETVAIKKLDLILFEKDKYLRKQIVQEIEIMSKLNHKNIVKFVELLATKKSLFIVTEMCHSGDLKSLIASKNISEQQAIDIMLQILEGFKELIKSGVIHRDMKPANVLNDMGTVKIADFGFAKYVENYSSQLLKSCVGSPLYMAPQVLERHHYSTKCDIWSLGVIFYEMLHFDVPWKGRDEDDLLHNIKTQPLQFKNDLSSFSKQFLTITLVIEEDNRASWNQIFDLSNTSDLQKSVSAEDINEESIQKLPTWIQRPSISQRQDKKVDEQKYQQIEELHSLRKQLAYQHFIMTECYTEQINNENNGELQQESIKQLLNYINENIVKESQDLIQASIELYQKFQQKNLLWKMQEQLNAEHNYYMQMSFDAKKLFVLNQYQGRPDDKQINEAKYQLQKCKNSYVNNSLLITQIGCFNVVRFDKQLQLEKMILILKQKIKITKLSYISTNYSFKQQYINFPFYQGNIKIQKKNTFFVSDDFDLIRYQISIKQNNMLQTIYIFSYFRDYPLKKLQYSQSICVFDNEEKEQEQGATQKTGFEQIEIKEYRIKIERVHQNNLLLKSKYSKTDEYVHQYLETSKRQSKQIILWIRAVNILNIMNNIIDFIKKNGNPFETLELDMTADKKEIKSQYKELARKYHPDKNLNTKEIFIKIQKAYEFVVNNLADIHKYVEHQKFRQQEHSKMSNEQRQYAEDLKRREQFAEKQRQQDEVVKQMKVNEEMTRLEEQRKFEENEKKQKQEKLIQFELQNQDLYKRLNTIKIKWAKDQLYTSDLLSLLFKNYGAIQEIKIQDNKRKATITFHTTEAASNAVIQSNSGFLKVKHFMKEEKRQQVQKQLQTEKERINRNDQDVYQLSTDTLNRISHFYNKDSKIKEGLDELKREQERLKLINQIYEEELNK